jgi:tyrosinase
MQSLVLLLAVSSLASAALLPRSAPNLPNSAFPKFHTISLADAEAGKDLPHGFHNTTHNQPNVEAVFLEEAATAVSAAEAACSAAPNVRIEWRSYPTADRLGFIAAIKCMMNLPPSGNFPPATSRYEDFARLHRLYMPNIHGNAKFLPWHRYFLWTFEMALRDECNFWAQLPWWDETLDAGNFHNSDMFTNTNYFGHLPGPDANGNPVCIVSGAFAGLTCNIGPGSSNTPHCLSRAVDESLTAQCNSGFVSTCNGRTDYADMESCSELGFVSPSFPPHQKRKTYSNSVETVLTPTAMMASVR